MKILENKLLQATKNILEENLKISDERKILILDKNSPLSKKISDAYLKNFLDFETKKLNFLEKFLVKT